MVGFFCVGVANGQRCVNRWMALGSTDLSKRLCSRLQSVAGQIAVNDNRIRDYAQPSKAERTRFNENTALWDDEIFLKSAPYMKLLAPLGLRYQMRLLAYDGRRFLGWAGLARKRGSAPFTARDRRRLQPLVQPSIATLLAAEQLEQAALPQAAGDFVMRPDGRLLLASKSGREWLARPGFAQQLAKQVRRIDKSSQGERGEYRAAFSDVDARVIRVHGDKGVQYLVHVRPQEPLLMNPDATLSARQRQVAHYVTAGATLAETATFLGVSTETVRSHIREIYRRLEVANRMELIEALS